MSPDLVVRVAASRAAQGLPAVVTDLATLSKAGELLRLPATAGSRGNPGHGEGRPTTSRPSSSLITNGPQPAADLTTSPSCLPG